MLAKRAAVAATVSALTLGLAVAVAAPARADVPRGDLFHAVKASRLLDTRSGLGGVRPTSGKTFKLTVVNRGGVPANATAVVLNLTALNAQRFGYLTAWPSGLTRPPTSNVNFAALQTVANLSIVRLNAGGVNIFNGSGGTVDVLADVTGYYTAPAGPTDEPGGTVATNPARLLDTRTTHKVASRGTVSVAVAGRGGIPATGATAVILNLTAANSTRSGYLTAWASGTPLPLTSAVNFVPGSNVANLAVVNLGTNGAVSIYNGSPAPVDILADAVGYILGPISPTPDDGTYVPVRPIRVLDTRTSTGGARPASHGTVTPRVRGVGQVPANNVGAVVVEVTAVTPAAGGYVTSWDAGDRPTTSMLNFTTGKNAANLAIVPVGCDGRIALFNGSTKPLNLLADVVGYIPQTHSACWHDVTPSLPSGSVSGAATAVSCLATGECLVVGNREDTTGASFYWYSWRAADGTWGTVTNLPTPPGGTTRINDVSCSSTLNCVAVFTNASPSGAYVLRWDGVSWTTTALPQPLTNPAGVNAVSCPSDTNCIAAGTTLPVGKSLGGAPVIWTFDGTNWTAATPNRFSFVEAITGVSCAAVGECQISGGATRPSPAEHYALVITVSGGVATTNFRPVTPATLAGISCPATNECYAVGRNIAADTVDAATGMPDGAWALSGKPKDALTAVSCPAAGTCAAVGAARVTLRNPTTGWQAAQNVYPLSRTTGTLAHVSCVSATNCLAVGSTSTRPIPWVEAYS